MSGTSGGRSFQILKTTRSKRKERKRGKGGRGDANTQIFHATAHCEEEMGGELEVFLKVLYTSALFKLDKG